MQTEAFLSLPSPDIFFTSRTHKIAWNYLIYGIKEHEPYLLVAGDYGMGKTLLCLKLVKALQTKDLYPFTYISNSNYSYATIIREIVKRLGLTIHTEDEASLQRVLYDYFEAQKPLQPFYCILDDVQEFDPMTLVKLRLLANFNASGVFPLRMIFFAHTSFLERLKSPSMEPLDQRIKRRYTLVPFDLHDTKEYIYFRLLQAGAVMSPYFTDAAIGHLFEHTGGIPRLINNICDACLLIGASREMEEIDAPLVDEAVEYLGWRRHDIEHQDIPYVAEEEAKEAEQEPRPDQREEEPNRGYAYERGGGGGEGLDFTNIGENDVERDESTPLFSEDYRRPTTWTRIKSKLIVLLLILIGAFIVWTLFQKGMLGISRGSTIDPNEIENRFMIYENHTENQNKGFQHDGKRFYSMHDGKEDVSDTDQNNDKISSTVDAYNKANLVNHDHPNIITAEPHINFGLDSPVKHAEKYSPFKQNKSSHAYSLILSSCRKKENAVKALFSLKEDGFSPLFLGKLNLGKRGVWWAVYSSYFKTLDEADKAKEQLGLTKSIIKKVPYANLIGTFSAESAMENKYQHVKALGYFPYTMETEKDLYRLLVGGHITLAQAEEQRLALQSDGIQTRVVKR